MFSLYLTIIGIQRKHWTWHTVLYS